MKLDTPVRPGMESLQAASRISSEVEGSGVASGVVSGSSGWGRSLDLREGGGVEEEERGEEAALSSPTGAQDMKGGRLGRP